MKQKIIVASTLVMSSFLSASTVFAATTSLDSLFTTSLPNPLSIASEAQTKLWEFSPISPVQGTNGSRPLPLGWQPQPMNVQLNLDQRSGSIPAGLPGVGSINAALSQPGRGSIPANLPTNQNINLSNNINQRIPGQLTNSNTAIAPPLQVPTPTLGSLTPYTQLPPLSIPGQVFGKVNIINGNGPFPLGFGNQIPTARFAPTGTPLPLGFGGGNGVPAGLAGEGVRQAFFSEQSSDGKQRVFISGSSAVFADAIDTPHLQPITPPKGTGIRSDEGQTGFNKEIIQVSPLGAVAVVAGLPPLSIPNQTFGTVIPVNTPLPLGFGRQPLPAQLNEPRSSIPAGFASNNDIVQIDFGPRPRIPALLTPENLIATAVSVEEKEHNVRVKYIPPGGPFPLETHEKKQNDRIVIAPEDDYPLTPPKTEFNDFGRPKGRSSEPQIAGLQDIVTTDHEKTYQEEISEIDKALVTAAPQTFFEDHIGKKLPSGSEERLTTIRPSVVIRLEVDETGHVQTRKDEPKERTENIPEPSPPTVATPVTEQENPLETKTTPEEEGSKTSDVDVPKKSDETIPDTAQIAPQ